MGAVTYPNPRVIGFIEEQLIPLQVAHNAQPIATDFNVKWTPTLIVLGPDQREHHRSVGFLAPEALIPMLLLGIGKYHFDHDRYDQAASQLAVIQREFPASDALPEAIYLTGVLAYKSTGKARKLKEAYERLAEQFPTSEWTRRASPYRLL